MKKTAEWVIVCYGLLIFSAVAGIIGGIWGGDKTGIAGALLIALAVGAYAVNKGNKAGI